MSPYEPFRKPQPELLPRLTIVPEDPLHERFLTAPAIARCPGCGWELLWYAVEEKTVAVTCFCGERFVGTTVGHRTRPIPPEV